MRAISLTLFNISSTFPTLSVGGLFFRTNANTYAFILNGHNGLATNGLYQITATRSAQTVLGNPSANYRPAAQVWASPNGTHRQQQHRHGKRRRHTSSSQPLPAAQGQQDVYFAAATCGNDEITGAVPPSGVPEPGASTVRHRADGDDSTVLTAGE